MTARYKQHVITKTPKGYMVGGTIFKSLTEATDSIDRKSK